MCWHYRIFFLVLWVLIIIVSVPAVEDVEGIISGPASDNIFRLKAFSDEFRVQLDPIGDGSYIFISEQLYTGLVRLDNNLDPSPALAEYWDKSHDGRTYRFYIRRGVLFHHGAELTAEDIKFSFERILDPETESPFIHFFLTRVVGAQEFYSGEAAEVTGFKVINPYTFEIQWTKPYAMALYLMSMHFCKILPKDRLLDQGIGFFQKPSGTGPFKFDQWLRDTRLNIVGVRMHRNDNYFEGTPHLEYVDFCPHYRLDNFLNGEIESIPVLSEKLLKSDYQIFKDGSIHPFYLGMSCHIPPFNNNMVRKALAAAIHKSEIIRVTYEAEFHRQLLSSYIHPKLPGFFLSDDRDTYNLHLAKELLEDAGFNGEHRFPSITLLMEHPRTEFKNRLYRELRRQLEELEISLDDRYIRDMDEVMEIEEPYLILSSRLLNIPDPEDIIRPLFYSKSPTNYCGFSSSELDDLLQQAEVESSWTQRTKLFLKIENILKTEVPAIPIFSQQNRVAMQPYVQGVQIPAMGFYYIQMDRIRLEK